MKISSTLLILAEAANGKIHHRNRVARSTSGECATKYEVDTGTTLLDFDIDGTYSYRGTFNGNPFYEKDGADEMYLYRNSASAGAGNWHFHTTLGYHSALAWAFSSPCPPENATWKILTNRWIDAPGIKVGPAGCPWTYKKKAFIPGYAEIDGVWVRTKFSDFDKAKAECLRIDALNSRSVCTGFSKGADGTYTLRKGSAFKTSPYVWEESWMPNNDCDLGTKGWTENDQTCTWEVKKGFFIRNMIGQIRLNSAAEARNQCQSMGSACRGITTGSDGISTLRTDTKFSTSPHHTKFFASLKKCEKTSSTSDPPVNGGWSAFGIWSDCSNGSMSRSRTCDNPKPANGGKNCVGSATEKKTCIDPIDGNWSSWTSWTDCVNNSSKRVRTCTNPAPSNGGRTCLGAFSDKIYCTPLDGNWGKWSSYSACKYGKQQRKRLCDSPPPKFGGKSCKESADPSKRSDEEVQELDCGVPGNWGEWKSYGECKDGKQKYFRVCDNPEPKNGGQYCLMPDGTYNEEEREERTCAPKPINGGWSAFGVWGDCNNGSMKRFRQCNNPAPAYGGNNCAGSATESKTCVDVPQKVNGGWSAWTKWTDCVNNSSQRVRTCTNPPPSNGGRVCLGAYSDKIYCTSSGPVDGNWGTWSNWNQCWGGKKQRFRLCNDPTPKFGGKKCKKSSFPFTDSMDELERKNCAEPIDGNWGNWSSYSVCKYGKQVRQRLCNNPAPASGGKSCKESADPSKESNEEKQEQDCGEPGNWGEWKSFGECKDGKQKYFRVCDNPEPKNGGQYCLMPDGTYNEEEREERNCELPTPEAPVQSEDPLDELQTLKEKSLSAFKKAFDPSDKFYKNNAPVVQKIAGRVQRMFSRFKCDSNRKRRDIIKLRSRRSTGEPLCDDIIKSMNDVIQWINDNLATCARVSNKKSAAQANKLSVQVKKMKKLCPKQF